MPQFDMSNSDGRMPFVAFGEAYDIAEGTRVFPLTLARDEIKPPFETTIFVVEAGASTPLDKHRVEELWVILEGSGRLEYADRTFDVAPLDRLIFRSQHEHRVANAGAGPLRILSVYWPPSAQSDDLGNDAGRS